MYYNLIYGILTIQYAQFTLFLMSTKLDRTELKGIKQKCPVLCSY